MTDKTDVPANPPVMENLFAAEVYADSADFFWIKGGNVSITFTSGRIDNTKQPPAVNRVVVGRLIMPVDGARNLAMGLYDYLKKQGLVPETMGPRN